ncbi:MAG: insulinase family protein [Bacteriovoracaceae bacterium]|nr:insulinase family protein [Bacteriovoracaceae bacterium]
MKIEQKILSNNLNTLFINSPGSACASVQIWFRAGSALEKPKDLGIAHFLEHMFFKGTQKRPGAQIARDVESYGGEVNAFTSFDYTCYYINTPNHKLEKTVDILMDMVTNPLFEQDELTPEREVVFEEYRRSLDNPSQFNFFQLQKNCFTKNYKYPILGTEKTIKSFTREQLIEFRKENYNSSNALLIVSGDIHNESKLTNLIERYKLPAGKETKFPAFKLKPEPQVNVHKKDVNQVTVTLNIQAPEYISDEGPIEDLALNCLAYGEISPLYKRLVSQSHLASGISGSTMFFNKGGSHFIRLALPEDNLQAALNEFLKTLKESLSKGFQEDEVLRIKNQYVASKIYERESIESFAFTLGHGFAQSGDIHCEEEFIQQIKNTSRVSVSKALIDIFSKPAHINAQIPKKSDSEKVKKQLEAFQVKLSNITTSIKQKTSKFKQVESKFDPEVKVLEIKKGVKLVYRKNKVSPTFVLHAYLKGGLAYESQINNGIYHFTSKLLTYGYGKTGFEELKNELEKKSAYMHGFSGKNAYGINLHGLSENFEGLVKHFAGSLLKPSFPNQYFKIEKELAKRQLLIQKEDPVKICFTNLNQTVFNKHPYSMDIIGNEKSLKKIKRSSLIDLHQERLNKSEVTLVYCGSDELENVIEKLQPIFKELTPRNPKSKLKNKIDPQFGRHINIDFEREQTHIFIGRPSFQVGTTEDLYLKMLTSYLSGQSSELFVDVRDRKGLCYAVQPLHHTALEAGYWGIYIGAGNEKTQKAIDAILGVVNKLRDRGLSKREFNRIKNMIDGQNLLNIQTNDDYANFYAIPVLHHLGLDYQHISFEKIRNFNHDDFNRFLKRFLTTDWNIIQVGKQN